MAFTVTLRSSVNDGTTAAQTRASGSFTPTANSRLFVFAFSQRDGHAFTQNYGISNTGGLSFTKLDESTLYAWNGNSGYAANCVAYYADVGSSPSSMTVTIDPDTTSTSVYYTSMIVFDVTGYDTDTPFAQASVDNGAELSGGDSESGTLTLGSAPTSGNLVVAMFGSSQDSGGGFADPSGYSNLAEQSVGYTSCAVFYKTDTTTAAVTCTDLGNTVGNWGGIIFEMTAAAGGPADVNATSSEAATVADTGTAKVSDPQIATPAEAASVADTPVLSVQPTDTPQVSASEAVTVADTPAVSLPDALKASSAEAVTVADTATASLPDALAVSSSEAVTVADTGAAAITDIEDVNASASEAITVADSPVVSVEELAEALFVRVTPSANYVQIVTP